MKKIEAIIKHFKLDEVKDALAAAGVLVIPPTLGTVVQVPLNVAPKVAVEPARRVVQLVRLHLAAGQDLGRERRLAPKPAEGKHRSGRQGGGHDRRKGATPRSLAFQLTTKP